MKKNIVNIRTYHTQSISQSISAKTKRGDFFNVKLYVSSVMNCYRPSYNGGERTTSSLIATDLIGDNSSSPPDDGP